MRKFYVLLIAVLFAASAKSQINTYLFAQSSTSYTPITGGTVIVSATDPLPSGNDSAAMDDYTYAEYALPFPFYTINGVQTSFRVNSNGWLGFGSGSTTNSTTPLSSTLTFNAIVGPFAADLMGLGSSTGTTTSGSNVITAVGSTASCVIGAPIQGTGIPAAATISSFTASTITISANATSTNAATFISWCTGEIRTNTLGVAPNRTFVIQFTGLAQYSTTTTSVGLASQISYQIRLFEGGGVNNNQTITIVYGGATHPGGSTTGQLGLRGSVNTDYFNRTTTTDWSATTPGGSNSATVTWAAAINPPSGLTFTYTPPPPCVTPPDQGTSLALTPGATAVAGTFTAAASAPTGYLVVRTSTAAPPSAPVDGTTYTPGASALGGVIVSQGTTTNFLAMGLSQNTTYYFWVYTYNNNACIGGPAYRSASPLSGNTTTTSCSISGTRTVGPTGFYPTLTAGLLDLFINGQTGPVVLELQSAYTSGGETFPVTIPMIPCASAVNTLTIRPEAGASALVITSANGTATLDMNGAIYATVDGRPGGIGSTSQLTITNTATGTAVAARMINDASNNTITYCTLNGSTSATNGVVYLATGTVTGNDNNTISNNNIGPAGANLSINGIVSIGTSAAINNSGNTVTGNNIFDYFSAGSASNGINLGTGNSTWTISNNRLYQTATRLYTTANTHAGINITSGDGYTITGNTIGYANSSATGTTNMIGNSVTLAGFPGSYTVSGTATATRYIGINGTFTAGGAVSSIQNNTIAGFAMYTSNGTTTANGMFCGIAVNSGPVNIGTVTGNTIGSTSGNSSIYVATSTSGGIIAGIYVSSADAINIRNNTIGGLDAMGNAATISGGINGINIAGTSASYDVSGNTIGNTTNPSLRMGNLTTGANLSNVGTTFGTASGVGTFNGILSTLTTTGTIGTAALPNIIRNASLNTSSASTSASVRGITASGSPVISSNQISNLTSANTNTGVGSTLLAGMGIFLNSVSTNGAIVTKNNINGLSLSNNGTGGTNIAGIAVYAGTSEVSANTIYDISNASTSTTAATPGTVSGIFMRQPAGTQTVINNMISLGSGQTTNTSFNGIWLQNSVVAFTLNCYHNSINIEGVAASGAQPSFGFNRGSYSATQVLIPVDIRNNVFTNTRSGGTGKHYAIANNYLAAGTNTGWGVNASNYNVLNAAAANVGYWTSDQTFASWKATAASDASSVSGVAVNYVNTAIGNLHLNFGVTPTPLESGGVLIASVTTDIDNQTRPGPAGSVNGGAFAPDLGADEFDGVFSDVIGPDINYTPLAASCSAGARTLNATITDLSGVPVSGIGLPVLYWKINAGAYTAATGVSLGGNVYQFTFGAGSVSGDVVSYYIVAQDLASTPNLTVSPNAGASGLTANPPAAATPPTTPNSYLISSLTGTYTVGAGGNFPTLTAAVAAYNVSCLNGPITFVLTDASYSASETFPITILQNGTASAVNTLTIKPAPAVTSTISGSIASGAIIKMLGNYVIIDGSNNGSTSRNLTITNTNATSPSVVLIGSTGTTPVTNVTLKNTIVINGANTASAVVVSDGAVLATAGYFNNITIQNNSIQKAFVGNYNIAVVAPGNGSGLNVNSNDLTTSGANAIRLVGIYVQGADGAIVQNNSVSNITTALGEAIRGIWLASGTSNSTVTGNSVTALSYTGTSGGFGPIGINVTPVVTASNNNITDNIITNLSSSGTTGPSSGITVSGASGGVNLLRNKISNIKNSNTGGYGSNGIQLTSSLTAANITVANNFVFDVASYGFATLSSLDDNGYGIILTSGGGYNLYYNTVHMNTNQTVNGLPAALNIYSGVTTAGSVNVRNNIFTNSQTVGTDRYAIYSSAANTVFAAIDYNDYYSSGPNLGFIGSNRSNLAAIQAGFGGNLNSVSAQPVFVSASN
jgi:hypothetical protein